VIRECALDKLPPGRCQVNDAGPAVARIVLSIHQPLALQPINGNADRTAGQPDLLSDLVHRKAALVKQNLQNAEVRETQPERSDVLQGVGLQGVESLPENEPEVDSAAV